MQKVKNLPGEKWKRHKENSTYWISNKGRLITTRWKGSTKQRFFRPAKEAGYLRTVLVINGENVGIRIHRLVAEYFVHNPDPILFTEVNHKDRIRDNNDYKNLEWTNHEGNYKHAIACGAMVAHPGSRNGFSKLTERQVLRIRKLFKPHIYTSVRLSQEFGVSVACIKDALYRRWNHI